MAEAALKAGVWIKAQIRMCDVNLMPAIVVRRGDPDAGVVLIKLNRLGDGVEVLSQVRTADGARAWMRGTGEAPVGETEADAYIERQVKFDPDLWVLEIEDPQRRYRPDGEIV